MKALEIFPCSGGMAEGFRRAGIVFDWAFDHSKEACDSYEANHGHRPVQMDARDLLRLVQSGWRPAEQLDLVVADPPCTPWSRAGKRLGVEDERDMLNVPTEVIRLLRPRAYLIGNVPGLDDSTQWHHLQTALAPLRKAGYCIANYASLDAADYGVPQHRVRPFWFGHIEGPCLRWPLPTHGPPASSLPGLGLKPWVTCRDALGHLVGEALGHARSLRYRGAKATTEAQRKKAGKKARASRLDEPAEVVRARADAVLALGRPVHQKFNQKHQPSQPSQPSHTITASGARHQSNCIAWPWERPATTVTSTDRLPPRGHHPESGSILSQPNAVALSEQAGLILQGFPETWKLLSDTKTGRWSMLGQAMPPALAEAVAGGVVEHFAALDGNARVIG